MTSLAKPLALAIAFMFSAGCQSLSVSVPGVMLQGPEIETGRGGFIAAIKSDPAVRQTFTDDASARPPNLANPKTETAASNLGGHLSYVPLAPLEIGGLIHIEEGLGFGGFARLQLLGVHSDNGPKVSVFGHYSQINVSKSGDQNGVGGRGGYNWSSEIGAVSMSAGASAGYRFDPMFLLYLSAGYGNQALRGNIHHQASDDGRSGEANYSMPNISANAKAAAVGLRYGRSFIFSLEGQQIYYNWPKNPNGSGGEKPESILSVGFLFVGGRALNTADSDE